VFQHKGVFRIVHRVIGVLLFLALLGIVPAYAQAPTGTILGSVKDASGGLIAGATVTALNMETGLSRSVPTGEDGSYRFDALPVGRYSLKIEHAGFKTITQTGIVLDVSQEVVINVSLQVGGATQEVVVTGEAPQVNTTSGQLGGLVNEEKMAELPLNGRDYTDLTLLEPGVAQTHAVVALGGGTGGTIYSSNGAPLISNNFLLDGAPTQSVFGLNGASAYGSTLGVDGIREYKVITNAYDASYGMTMGSQMLLVSKGGSNQWHGDAFEFIRNDKMDAKNFFDQPPLFTQKPQYQRNNFGGSAGGPIKKDKAFFYAVYEGLRERKGLPTYVTEPSSGCHAAGQPQIAPEMHSTYGTDGIVGTGGALSGGTYLVTGVPSGGSPAANECFGAGLSAGGPVNSAIVPILALFPMPNRFSSPGVALETNNFEYIFIQPSQVDHGQIRFDENFGTKDSIFGRYTIDQAVQFQTDGTIQFNDQEASREQVATVAENHIFSPTLLNTLRVSYSRPNLVLNDINDPAMVANDLSFAKGGLGVAANQLEPIGQVNTTYQFESFGGDAYSPNDHLLNTTTLSDDLYYTKGKHAFRFGVLINRFQFKDAEPHGKGTLTFGFGSPTFNPLQNMILGDASALAISTPGSIATRVFDYMSYGVYAQDDWRVTQRLTLNLGLRYEINTTPQEHTGGNPLNQASIPDLLTNPNAVATTPTTIACTDPAAQNPTIPSCNSAGNVITNVNPNIRVTNNPSLHNFAPRVGFAYDVFGDGKTSVRGAAGIYYDIASFAQGLFGVAQSGLPYTGTTTLQPSFGSLAFGSATYQPPAGSAAAGCTSCFGNSVPFTPVAPGFPGYGPNLPLDTFGYQQTQPTLYQWNLSVERQLPGNIALTASYVGTKGIHLWGQEQGDPCLPEGYLNGLPEWINGSNTPCPLGRFNPNFGQGGLVQMTRGESWYHGLQIGFTKKLQSGLEFQGSYTYSKASDIGQGQQTIEAQPNETNYNLMLDRGASNFDTTNNFRFNTLYHFHDVASNNFAAKLIHGWWTGSIVSAQSGFPFTPVLGTDNTLDNTTAASGYDRPNFGPTFNAASVITHNTNEWYNPTMFSVPQAGTLGDVGRDSLRGPRFVDWDLTLAKDTKIKWLGEGGALQFRADFFNLLNHPNFGLPTQSFNGTPGGTGGSSMTNANCPAPTTPSGCPIVGTVTANGTFSAPLINPANPNSGSYGKSGTGQIVYTVADNRDIQLSLKLIF